LLTSIATPFDSAPKSTEIHDGEWQQEEWFGVKFSHMSVPCSLRTYWRLSECEQGDAALKLPPKNQFIPKQDAESFKRMCTSSVSVSVTPMPTILAPAIWFSHDKRFRRPKSEIMLSLSSSLFLEDVQNAVCKELLARLFEDSFAETAYLAELAELSISLRARSDEGKWNFALSGLSEKALSLLRQAVMFFINANFLADDDAINAARLVRFKKLLLDEYGNASLKSDQVSNDRRLDLLVCNRIPLEDRLQYAKSKAFLEDLTCDGLRTVHRALCVSSTLTVLAEGELDGQELQETIEGIRKEIDLLRWSNTVVKASKLQTLQLPDRTLLVIHSEASSANERNVAAEIYFQFCNFTLEEQAKFDLLESLMFEPFFDSLRTKQQVNSLI
jgi:secreted Zn-dependent insulinase-like peptidase